MNGDSKTEQALVFECEGQRLVGILHTSIGASTGVLLVSGGDQYRVGSHRLFVELARALAAGGVAVMRFDHRGVGDTAGDYRGFENLQTDIDVALGEFKRQCPHLDHFVLSGLCDGASAALIAAPELENVDSLALINPWVHTSDLEARTRVLNYYASRLRSRDFWKKLLRGQIQFSESWRSLTGYVKMFFQSIFSLGRVDAGMHDYVKRMLHGAQNFHGTIHIILSGQDLVAQQFQQLATIDRAWKQVLDDGAVKIIKLPGADHTFSVGEEQRKFEQTMLDWFAVKAK